MNFWEKITGSDMTKELKTFESRGLGEWCARSDR